MKDILMIIGIKNFWEIQEYSKIDFLVLKGFLDVVGEVVRYTLSGFFFLKYASASGKDVIVFKICELTIDYYFVSFSRVRHRLIVKYRLVTITLILETASLIFFYSGSIPSVI